MVKSDGPDIFRGAMNADLEEVKNALSKDPALLNFQEEKMGATPLHVAVWYGNYDVVDFLCSQPGVDIGIMDNLGRPTWFGASATGREDIVNRIFEETDKAISAKIAQDGGIDPRSRKGLSDGGSADNVTRLHPKPPSV